MFQGLHRVLIVRMLCAESQAAKKAPERFDVRTFGTVGEGGRRQSAVVNAHRTAVIRNQAGCAHLSWKAPRKAVR